MPSVFRAALGSAALLLGVSLGTLGCDAGGLLVAEGKEAPQKTPLKGHSSTELVNGGTLAKNSKYKMFYVLGQPSPQQGAAANAKGERVNGGITGAVQGQ